MPLYIYNSETHSKVRFQPIKANEIGIYVCGITVYDYCHIGHARTMIAFDYIVRFLRSQGWNVRYIRNITDIDDKIIQRANENHESIYDLTSRFIDAMHEDFHALGCLNPDIEPKATDHIQDIQDITQTLINKGFAYQSQNGDIYFSVENYPAYGRLSGRKLQDMQAGASERVALNHEKLHPFDFVLWKAAKLNEPAWQSAWGNGRPGWHIECSAMSMCHLGEHFDIHGGGGDLIFPHHENEVAQSEAASGKKYVNYWLHTGFITVDGEKMSKSLGNFMTIRDALKAYHPEVIRFLMISSHYRSPIHFSRHILQDTEKTLLRFYQAFRQVQLYLNQSHTDISIPIVLEHHFIDKFNAAMNDDFNTPEALAICFELLKQLNIALKEKSVSRILEYYRVLLWIGQVLNLFQQDAGQMLKQPIVDQPGLSEQDIEQAIQDRQVARANKQFALADGIRQELLQQGIILEDTANQTVWRYKGKSHE